jgi:glycosyltransferase involved in cell wall biosynthesis
MATRTIAYDHQIFSLQSVGGISRYFCELAERLAHQPGFRTRVVAPMHFNDHLAESKAPCVGIHLPMKIPRSSRGYRMVNSLLSPPILTKLGPDIIHRTYYAARPETTKGRLVVTVFDMIHELFPQCFGANDQTADRKLRSVEAADHVICISECTAQDLVRLLNVPRKKITVTHLGLSSTFAAPASGAHARDCRPYLLFVGQRGGYKNFSRLLAAYASSAALRDEFDLVAFGPEFARSELEQVTALNLRAGAVRRLGGTDAELARAYQGAWAFVYPSEYEGFGIPPLEAMSSGCPVICSNASCIPEVVGDAGEYFDPASVDAICGALERVAFDASRRLALIEAGQARHRHFSWERCAIETAAVYENVLAA